MRIIVGERSAMLSLAELSRAVDGYQNGDVRLGAFEDWFRDNSRGMFAESDEVIEACNAIESAFSRYYFEGIGEQDLRRDLAAAIRPFAQPRDYVSVVSGESSQGATLANSSWLRLEVEVS
jgi:hypothetical protein